MKWKDEAWLDNEIKKNYEQLLEVLLSHDTLIDFNVIISVKVKQILYYLYLKAIRGGIDTILPGTITLFCSHETIVITITKVTTLGKCCLMNCELYLGHYTSLGMVILINLCDKARPVVISKINLVEVV